MTPNAWDAVLNVYAEDDYITRRRLRERWMARSTPRTIPGWGCQAAISASSPSANRSAAVGKGIVDWLSRRDS